MKAYEIHLDQTRWQSCQVNDKLHLHLAGTAYVGNSIQDTPAALACHLPSKKSAANEWIEALSKLNGFFSAVWVYENCIFATVDHVRSIPLFYGCVGHRLFISDDAEYIRTKVNDNVMDKLALSEFQLTGYVTGKDTLYPKVKQLQAGEFLIAYYREQSITVSTHRYYRFLHDEPADYIESDLRRQLDVAANACIDRLISYAKGRQIVIPLSGGYDSRLISTLLCRNNHKNLLAFSYGVRGNKESAYSQQVAKSLGLRWEFVEYSQDHWRTAWHTPQRRQYQRWASNWTSMPHVQDWTAVRALHHKGVLEPDCVFVPGHSGDFVAGSHIPEDVFQGRSVNVDSLVKHILRQHYRRSTGKRGPRPIHGLWRDRVLDRAEKDRINAHIELADTFEKWDWQERQAKYICNSVRVYEFFGYDWWMPLWDREFIQFWQQVPVALREKRHWYLSYVKAVYADYIDLETDKSLSNATDIGRVERFARSLVDALPIRIKQKLKTFRYRVSAMPVEKAYFVSHLTGAEIKQLSKQGYHGDDMLIHEFLNMMTQESEELLIGKRESPYRSGVVDYDVK